MIKSAYIKDIVTLLVDQQADGVAIQPQLDLISDTLYGYTSAGLFVNFSHDEGIVQHKCIKPDLVINGVKITCAQAGIEAAATLFFKGGIIDHLEIVSNSGSYPRQDLADYNLSSIGS